MAYLVINLTSSGAGYEVIGTFKSKQRAVKIANALDDANPLKSTVEDDNGYTVLKIESLDKYTDESIIENFKIEE